MKIGMMADVYKPHISGITNYISLNKQYLEAKGHEVTIFTFGDENYPDEETRVVRSPGLPLVDTGYYFGFNYSRQARKLVTSMDVIHVHHPFLSGTLALRYCRPRGIPLIFTNHTRYDLYTQVYLPILPEVVGDTMLQAYMPVFCRACDMVISPSPGMRDILRKFGVHTPIEVVPNGVDLNPLRKKVEPVERASQGFTSEDVVLIYTGRLGPEKNLPFLLRCFTGAAQAYEHVRLLLVGDGPERENLMFQVEQKGLSERIVFTGQVPYSDVYRYLVMADAFVTASVTEVHPLSVIEAMAAGLPVLGISSPGVGDLVEDGVTGFLAPEEDPAVFTAKMVRLTTDHAQRKAMGHAASQAAEAYAIERTTEIILQRYQQVITQAKKRKQGLRARLTRLWDRWVE